MQATVVIPRAVLEALFEAVFCDSPVEVFSSDSDPGQKTLSFASAKDVLEHLRARAASGKPYTSYAVHYMDAGGHVEDRRVLLNPERCNGHTFRYSVGGWGVIHIQIRTQLHDTVECRIAVNTQKRAMAWSDTYPDMKDPNLWNWPIVERHARRLIRNLKSAAPPAAPAHGSKPSGSGRG